MLRLRVGTELELFNGDGWFYAGRLTRASSPAEVEIDGRRPGPPAAALELALPLLKGDRMDWALQKSTELGVRHIHLLITEHSEVRVQAQRLDSRMAHWQRVLAASAQQSGRATLPLLTAPRSLDSVLATSSDLTRVALQPDAESTALPPAQAGYWVFTGPEGGFSRSEIEALEKAAGLVRFGDLTLRAETAPVVGLTLARLALSPAR